MGPMTEGEAMYWRMEAERHAQSDRPSPRGGGPAYDAARALIAQFDAGDLDDPFAAAVWTGTAYAVLRELTRDA